MPTRKHKPGKSKGLQYYSMGFAMMKSMAFRATKGTSLKVLHELRMGFNGFNNGDVSLGLERGSGLLGLSKSTMQRAFSELEKKGFIRKNKSGHFYGRKATTWFLTDQMAGRDMATNEWKRWRPETKKK